MAYGNVYLSVYGDGTAYTDAVPPLVNGEDFTIYSTPDAGATLEDIRVWTSFDEAIAITVSEEVTLTYRSEWRNVYVDVYFSGAPIPPEPEPPKIFKKFPWLLAKAANEWRM
jgi:hypothetical protein